jgi:predicted TIM-barrel fold metal-dependent hydrolase
MYTAQGYRPYDINRLPILYDFYRQCANFDIPILNHCTPDGAYTYDRSEYLNFTHPNDGYADEMQKKDPDTGYLRDGRKAPPRALGALEYFNRNFVAPKAWEPVLKKWPNLRLCLAHYGGDTDLGRKWGDVILKMMETKRYPNLYSDISSSFGKASFRDHFKKIIQAHPHLKSQILFGTDWYMTVMDNVDYQKFCKAAKDFLDSFDTGLWVRFTLINPIKFYKLDQQQNIDRIVNNIVEAEKRVSENDKLKYGLKGFNINEGDVRQTAAYIKRACG